VYVGGKKEWPTYQSIGDHTEGVMVTFNKDKVSYHELLRFTFSHIDPLASCYGRQYMSGVWWHNEEQKLILDQEVSDHEESKGRKSKLHREAVTPMYRAEEYHQNYFGKQGGSMW